MALNLIEELKGLVESFSKEKLDYAICGGIAVNIHGHPRTTKDIDLLIQDEDIPKAMDVLKNLGFDLIAGPIPFAFGTEKERKLYRASKVKDDVFLTVDLLVVTPILQDVWEERQVFQWLDRPVIVVSIKGLTKMKWMAHRHQDLADLENLGIEVENEDRPDKI